MKKNLQKSAILFGAKSKAYLQIRRPIFGYFWLFLSILVYLRICNKSSQIYFAFCAEYPCLFLPIFRHLTCAKYTSQISKNRQKSAFRFLAIFGDLCPIFGDFWRFFVRFYGAYCQKIGNPFFLINRRADTKIGI